MAAVPSVERFDDAAEVLEVAGSFLESRPVEHNVILTLLHQRARSGEAGRYWLARHDGRSVGVTFQSPIGYHAAITPMPLAAVRSVVGAMWHEGTTLPGVQGQADSAAAFAGAWSETYRVGARPILGMRLSALDTLRPPAEVPGLLRPAGGEDVELVTAWGHAFADELGEHRARIEDLEARVEAGQFTLWEAGGEPVCLVGQSDAVAGVVRIGPVYTPPPHRRRGFAAASVGAVSADIVAAGHTSILYTDLDNPTSNGVYRALGYAAVSEILRYEFAPLVETKARPARSTATQ